MICGAAIPSGTGVHLLCCFSLQRRGMCAPRGEGNGMFRHGLRSIEAIERAAGDDGRAASDTSRGTGVAPRLEVARLQSDDCCRLIRASFSGDLSPRMGRGALARCRECGKSQFTAAEKLPAASRGCLARIGRSSLPGRLLPAARISLRQAWLSKPNRRACPTLKVTCDRSCRRR